MSKKSLELKLQIASIGTCSRNSDVVEKLLEFIKPLVNSVLRRPSIDTYALCLASGASLIFKIDSDGTTIGLEFSVCGQIGVIFLRSIVCSITRKIFKVPERKWYQSVAWNLL